VGLIEHERAEQYNSLETLRFLGIFNGMESEIERLVQLD
jgi:hypothetical protein